MNSDRAGDTSYEHLLGHFKQSLGRCRFSEVESKDRQVHRNCLESQAVGVVFTSAIESGNTGAMQGEGFDQDILMRKAYMLFCLLMLSLCSLGWPQTPNPPASASQVLGDVSHVPPCLH